MTLSRPTVHVFVAHPRTAVRQAVWNEVAGTDVTLVGESGDGLDAVEEILRLAPDVALLAVDLPIRSGTDVCRLLQRERPVCRVLLLADDDDERMAAGLAAGASGGYLLPAPAMPLARAVRGAMRRESLPTPGWARNVLDRYATIGELGPGHGPERRPELTAIEAEIMGGLATGLTPDAIAAQLTLTSHLVGVHAAQAIAKLGPVLAAERVSSGRR